MAPRDFRYQIDDGPWVYETQELPFTIEGVTNANAFKVQPIGAVVSVDPIATITAVITPVMPRVYEGQTLSQIDNWSDFVSNENYDSTVGGIDRVEMTFTGDAVDAVTPFVLGESVGFTARAVNEFGQGESFVTVQSEVEYREIVTITGALIDVDVNEIVPDAVVLDPITLEESGTSYDATYTGLTAGDTRNLPFNFGALNDAGLPSFEIVDGVATGDIGLWMWDTSVAEELTVTHRWTSDGTIIPGETGQTIADVTTYPGVLKYFPQVSDGVTTREALSLGSLIEGGATIYAPTVSKIGDAPSNLYTAEAISTNPDTDSFDCGAAEAGKELVIVYFYGVNFSRGGANFPLDITMNGTDTPQTILSVADDRFKVAFAARYDVSAGGVHTMSTIPHSETADPESWNGYQRQAYLVSNHTVIQALPPTGTKATFGNKPTDLSASVKNGSRIIGGWRGLKDAAGTDADLTGLTQDGPFWWTGTNQDQGCYFLEATSGAEETRAMSFNNILNAASYNGILALLEIY
ncbi:MAG: hypothetical protein ACU0FH_02205 [Heliomarina sp.]|uniref:hypothetical protein n=1 Tax=Heliomarina sp. TaxID=2917556 RepID=UPI004059D5DA